MHSHCRKDFEVAGSDHHSSPQSPHDSKSHRTNPFPCTVDEDYPHTYPTHSKTEPQTLHPHLDDYETLDCVK